MAVGLPRASFVGFDTSTRAIARARELAASLRLTNVRFEEVDVEDFDAPPGSFDYAIAHGIFSWVPAPRAGAAAGALRAGPVRARDRLRQLQRPARRPPARAAA
jgi:SAM-dependent methyltransferase